MQSKKVLTNFIWRFLERSCAQIVTFVVSIVLARILDPVVYGTIAIVTVFTTILQVFVDSGLGVSLVQKKDADDLDFSTVFYFNILFSIVLYLFMFLAAPLIAVFYEMPELTAIIRVLSLMVIVSGIRNVQQAYITKNMQFRKFFWSTLIGTIVSAVVGILMAIDGYGVWALVGQTLTNSFVGLLVLLFTVRWRPKWMFSFNRLKGLFSFGWKLLASSLIDTLYNDLRTLIIGKRYTSADLAYYNKARTFPNIIVSNVNSSIDSVLLPAMSSVQTDRSAVRAMTRRAIQISTYIIMPLMMGLAVCAEPIVSLLLTEKWLFCVPYMQIFCCTFAFYPIHTANVNAIKAMGRSDLCLKLEIMKKLVGLILLLFSMWFGVMAMAYTLLISSVASQIINSWPNKKLLGYSYPEQLRDIFPAAGATVFMGAIVYAIRFLKLPDLLTLVIQVLVGAVVYVTVSLVCRIEAFRYVLRMAKSLLGKKTTLSPRALKKEQMSLQTAFGKTQGSKRIVFMATPTHGNLGDQAIVYSQQLICSKVLSEYKIVEVDNDRYLRNADLIESLVSQDDIIVIDGGGNLGTLWKNEDDKISDIIKRFSNNRIIVFPQTCFYAPDESFVDRLNRNREVYKQAKRLTIMLRDQESYDFCIKNFDGIDFRLVPDIVLSLKYEGFSGNRRGALLCFRTDCEKVVENSLHEKITGHLESKKIKWRETSTLVPRKVNHASRKKELWNKLREFSSAEIVITDRLHAMIFATITKTPCVALDNKSKKVSGVYEWIKNLSYVRVVDAHEDIFSCIEEVLAAGNRTEYMYPEDKIAEILKDKI